jgi:hypothetical protein
MGRIHRYLLPFLSLSLLGLTACIPYAYPNLTVVQGGNPGAQIPECRVFRVDVTAYQEDIGEKGEYKIVEIARRPDGSFPPQSELAIDRVYVANPALSYNLGRVNSIRVRIYRPGYKLVEMKPGDAAGKIEWQPAASANEQEKAIDELLQRPTVTAGGAFTKHTPPLDQGYLSSKATLLFAAAEYERVASAASSPEDATRLRNKAEQLLTMQKKLKDENEKAKAGN